MSKTEIFGENPFRSLRIKDFPAKKKPGTRQSVAEHVDKNLRLTPNLETEKNSYQERRRDIHAAASCSWTGFEHHSNAHSDGISDTEISISQYNRKLDENDRELFLASFHRVQPTTKVALGGFSLDEMHVLPTNHAMNIKKRKLQKPTHTPDTTISSVSCVQDVQTSIPTAVFHADTPNARDKDVPDADTQAFLQAMRSVRPLVARGRDVHPLPHQSPPPPECNTNMQEMINSTLEFALSFTDEYLEGHVVGLDDMTMNKLRSGALSPEAHVDLHGLNTIQAFEILRGFMKSSWYKGLRTVLIVPGRGRNSPGGVSVLREKLQHWLTQDPFKRVVLAFCTALPHDGGPGSVYVLLRKYRKKGRVYWERIPADADLY